MLCSHAAVPWNSHPPSRHVICAVCPVWHKEGMRVLYRPIYPMLGILILKQNDCVKRCSHVFFPFLSGLSWASPSETISLGLCLKTHAGQFCLHWNKPLVVSFIPVSFQLNIQRSESCPGPSTYWKFGISLSHTQQMVAVVSMRF